LLKPKVAKYFSTVASTNSALLADLERKPQLVEGTVYLTVDQTAGRGQGSNQWHSTPGANLTLSVLLRPVHLSVDSLFALNEAASLAIAGCVETFLPPHLKPSVRVKWPNDVYVDDQKIAGILIQNALRGSQLQYAVVGIGLNVNEVAFPAELQERATSLRQLTDDTVSLEDVSEELFKHLSENYQLTKDGNLRQLRQNYQQQLYRLGLPTRFMRLNTETEFTATITGVSREGRLALVHPGDQKELVDMHSIRFLFQ
jgi:BirA family biotin operon repressor/biotin-[acetyl-CoA-carboxylase] ligase